VSRVVAAAIRWNGKVHTLPPPARHHDIIRMIAETRREDRRACLEGDQGFVDEDGNFLNRYEAKAVAEQNGQILQNGAPILPQLFSENLW
jgi:hypothetical protein